MPIRTIKTRYSRRGKLSAGYQVEFYSKKLKRQATRPQKSETWTVHSDDENALAVWASVYGGTVTSTPGAGEKYFVVTETNVLPVVLPHIDLDRIHSQYMEAWATSGLARRCDGIDCVAWRKPPAGDDLVGELSTEIRPCICEADDLPEKERCKPTVRLDVLPADIWRQLPGIGVWQVHSGGWNSNTQLASDLDLIGRLVGEIGPGVRLNLRIVQVNSKHGDVPMIRLELDGTPEAAAQLAGSVRLPALPVTEAAAQPLEAVGTLIDVEQPDEAEVIADALDPAAASETTSPHTPSPSSPTPLHIEPLSGTHTPATDEDRITHAQYALIARFCARANVTEDRIPDLFETRYGLDITEATRDQATAFADYIRDQIDGRPV